MVVRGRKREEDGVDGRRDLQGKGRRVTLCMRVGY